MTDSQADGRPVLVTGGTGKQGGATVRALLERDVPVRALVRRPDSEPAAALSALGVQVVQGDLTDLSSLGPAVSGVRAVFSVQMPDLADLAGDSERIQGANLVAAAAEAGVPQFVHSSASGVGEYHRSAPGWAEGRWGRKYWEDKAYTQDLVRDAGFRYWTVLQPAFFMENLLRPSIYFVDWTEERFLSVLSPESAMALIAVPDIGAAAAAAITSPEAFSGRTVPLAGDRLTMREIAEELSAAWGISLAPPAMSAEEMLATPLPGANEEMMRQLVNTQEWMREVGQPATPEDAEALGITLTKFADWARGAGSGGWAAGQPA